jgi:hypothetical protein
MKVKLNFCKTWGFHGGEHLDAGTLGRNTAQRKYSDPKITTIKYSRNLKPYEHVLPKNL